MTVRLILRADDWYGVSASDLELARQISAVARDNEADSSTTIVRD